MDKIKDKKEMIKTFNKVVSLRSQAYLIEKNFCYLFQKVYGIEFEPDKYDGLVDSLQMGLEQLSLEEFEELKKIADSIKYKWH